LTSGQRLNHDDCLVSSDRRFCLCMQDDGNLVIYKGPNTKHRVPIWASNTHGKGIHPHRLEMQADGNLVIYDGKGDATWASGTHDRGAINAVMIMQSDGNLVIYNNSPRTPLWASQTHDQNGVDCQKAETWPHDWTKFEDEVLSLVNEIRAKGTYCGEQWRHRVSPIKQNWKLTCAARCHGVDMALHTYFDHVDPQGGTLSKRINEVGYQFRKIAENIAKGQTSPQDVVNTWIKSPSHCHSIMNDYQDIGIAYIGQNYYPESHVWVQNFGTLL
ncbi:unnamed protein product, partial [Rotaria sordida]